VYDFSGVSKGLGIGDSGLGMKKREKRKYEE
jgi:hypothetical protein